MPPVKRYKVRISAWIALGVLLCCAITVGVSAVEPCQRAVKRVITEVKWPHYSKTTVARWVAWGKQHPNYVPPKRKPIVSTREVEDMVSFACEMPSIESAPVETAMLEQTPDETLALDLDDSRPYLLELNSGAPTVALLNVPVQQAELPPSEAPEPQTWLFLLTGVAFLVVVGRRGLRRGQALDALELSASAL
ncbi:hypothetical protein [Terriglobus sp.]|uniref:hypothetical protein n=1 Tax=Terriglobus sp. TaxID=1889013 RepID=UPI003B0057DA